MGLCGFGWVCGCWSLRKISGYAHPDIHTGASYLPTHLPTPKPPTPPNNPNQQLALPPRAQAAVWHGYAWCRFRARKYYWRGRNAALRCWREWAEAEGSSSTTSEVGVGVYCEM